MTYRTGDYLVVLPRNPAGSVFRVLRRFGLAYVDYPTQRRILKDSGLWYREFLAAFRARVQALRSAR